MNVSRCMRFLASSARINNGVVSSLTAGSARLLLPPPDHIVFTLGGSGLIWLDQLAANLAAIQLPHEVPAVGTHPFASLPNEGHEAATYRLTIRFIPAQIL